MTGFLARGRARLTVRVRLFASFGLLVAATAVAGLQGLVALERDEAVLDAVTAGSDAALQALLRIDRDLANAQAAERSLLFLRQGAEDATAMRARFGESLSDAEDAWRAYSAQSTDEEERRLREAFSRAYPAWKALSAEVLEILAEDSMASRRDAIDQSMGASAAQFETSRRALADLLAFERADLARLLASQREAAQASRARMTTVVLVALLVAALLALLLVRSFTRPLAQLAAAARRIGEEGDLTGAALAVPSDDELGALANSFAAMAQRLRSLLADLHQASGLARSESRDLLAMAGKQAGMAGEQSSALAETSATVGEISQTASQATAKAESVIAVSVQAAEFSGAGLRKVEETIAGMERLGGQVQSIAASNTDLTERALQVAELMSTVQEVAENANVLALNASIEAARAGQQGKGFAVVAQEMRKLSEQSRSAAASAGQMLRQIQVGARAAVASTEEGGRLAEQASELARGAGAAISSLSEVIRSSKVAAEEIAVATRQQGAGVEQIVTAIHGLTSAQGDAVSVSGRIEQVASSLQALSQSLAEMVARYRV